MGRRPIIFITKLLGPGSGNLFYLYVVIDIYSRYVVGWMLARSERAKLAEALLADSIAKQAINPGQLTVHADRGTSMASKPVAFLLADLGVTKSHNRPHCSNDNPYSESQFRTLKYRPSFPARFGTSRTPTASAGDSSPGTTRAPPLRHRLPHTRRRPLRPGRAGAAQRGLVLEAAYAAHPERFVCKPPTPPALPIVAWINQPEEDPARQNLFQEVVS